MKTTHRHLSGLLAAVLWPLSLPASATSIKTDPCSSRPGVYLSAATGRIGQARVNSLPGPAAVSSGERQLSIGLSPRAALNGCSAIGLDYEYTRYEFTAINSRDRDLHRLQLPMSWTQETTGQRLSLSLVPGIATSSNVMKDFLNRGSLDDFTFTARLEHQPPQGSWGPVLGLTYDQSFGRNKLSPILGYELRTNNSIHFRLAYPDTRVAFNLGDRQRFIWRLFPTGQRWHVVTDDFTQRFDYQVRGLRSQINWRISFTQQWALEVMGGYEFDRRHVFTDDAGAVIDSSIDNEWTLGVALRFGDAPIASPHGADHLR